MPKITTVGADSLITVFKNLGNEIDGICKMGLFDGAGVVADAIKDACPEGESGDLRDSLGIAHMRQSGDDWQTIIGFDGKDSNGVPNQLKARALESGRSTKKGGIVGKHPFIRPAVNRVRASTQGAISNTITNLINDIIEEA